MTPFKMLEVSTKNHQMTVLRDDGLYRHIRFAGQDAGDDYEDRAELEQIVRMCPNGDQIEIVEVTP